MLLKQSQRSPVQTRQGQDLQHVMWSSEIDFIMVGLEEAPRPEATLGFLCSSGAVINLIISEIADFKLKSPLSTLEFRFISARPVQFSYLCYKLLQSGLISRSNKAVCLGSFSQCQS